jgi:hypothetical protein
VLRAADPAGAAAHVNGLGRILFEMGAHDPHLVISARRGH